MQNSDLYKTRKNDLESQTQSIHYNQQACACAWSQPYTMNQSVCWFTVERFDPKETISLFRLLCD
jgi:hypothetical protein